MNFPFGERAAEHVSVLAEDIGPRPAGSPPLRRAQAYLEKQLTRWGYRVDYAPFSYSRHPWLGLIYPAAGLLLLGGSLVFTRRPGLTIGMPLLGAVLPQISRVVIQSGGGDKRSRNLTAEQGGREGDPVLVCCAHLDTAPALPYRHPGLIWLHSHRLTIYQRAAVGLALFSIFRLLGAPVLPEVRSGVIALCALVGGWMVLSELLSRGRRDPAYSPGGNDNASGVGVLLALAEVLAQHPAENLRVQFLFTDAEETGLDGARAASRKLDPEGTRVINVDQVGAGRDLCFVRREGTVLPQRTDPALNDLLRDVHPAIRPLTHTRRAGDYRPFLRAGFRTAALEMTGSDLARRAYHTVRDTAKVVEGEALGLTAEVLAGVIRQLDRENTA